jgi:hypothetical protein
MRITVVYSFVACMNSAGGDACSTRVFLHINHFHHYSLPLIMRKRARSEDLALLNTELKSS